MLECTLAIPGLCGMQLRRNRIVNDFSGKTNQVESKRSDGSNSGYIVQSSDWMRRMNHQLYRSQ